MEKNIELVLPAGAKKVLYDLSLEPTAIEVELGLLIYRSSGKHEVVEIYFSIYFEDYVDGALKDARCSSRGDLSA
jgi:hypothetical protein